MWHGFLALVFPSRLLEEGGKHKISQTLTKLLWFNYLMYSGNVFYTNLNSFESRFLSMTILTNL